MECPACRAPALEMDTACRQCGFSLEVADRAFGIAPTLRRPVADLAQVLGSRALRRAQAAIGQLEQRFPQVTVAAVLAQAPEPAREALPVYAFWLFNRGQLSSAMEAGGENRLVLLLIDTRSNEAVAMIGYGLEPLMAPAQLQSCLQAAFPALGKGRHGAAIEAFTQELDRQLREICRLVPQQFGLADDSRWLDATVPGEPLPDLAAGSY